MFFFLFYSLSQIYEMGLSYCLFKCSRSILHLGILAYWIVNTVRYQLKKNGIISCLGEIVRIGNTQKVVTSSGKNTYDKIITTRKCTAPNKNLKEIYDILQTKYQPRTKRKSVVHKLELNKNRNSQITATYERIAAIRVNYFFNVLSYMSIH
jgi:hypothetical protein